MANFRERTARGRTARTLAEEILTQDSEGIFAIASEHELCRRFKISRVTVRLALGDLESRGLIFRKHGKGTFAFGRAKRACKPLGVLIKDPPTQMQWPIAELIRGFQFGAAASQANVLLLHASPREWSSDIIRGIGGILVIPAGTTQEEMELLQHMKVPFLLGWEIGFPFNRIDFRQAECARVTTEQLLMAGHERIAFLGGLDASLDELKKEGIQAALESVGKSSRDLGKFEVPHNKQSAEKVFLDLVHRKPRFTATITADDGIAWRFMEFLLLRTNVRIPEVMSVASFHQCPFPGWEQKCLSTVNFDFFEAGRKAAKSLFRASMTGESVADLVLPGVLVEGRTVANGTVKQIQVSAS